MGVGDRRWRLLRFWREKLLLTGKKATGKNVLAETLAWIFERPAYTISFHVNMGSAELIGTDTFRNNEVLLREGMISRCSRAGGFGILDEINMAKNDAVSVLHAALDDRRSIDVPGYESDRASSGDPVYRDDELRLCGYQGTE